MLAGSVAKSGSCQQRAHSSCAFRRRSPADSPVGAALEPGTPLLPPARGITRYMPFVRDDLADLEDEFEFDRHVQGQLGRAEGQAGMAPRVAENLDEEIRRAVDDGRLLGEAFGGGHVSGQSHDAGHAVERAQLLTDHGQGIERSEEHTSELQSLAYLVCRLLLEKKKKLKRVTKCVWKHNVHQ